MRGFVEQREEEVGQKQGSEQSLIQDDNGGKRNNGIKSGRFKL